MHGPFRKQMTVLSLLMVATMVIGACGAAVQTTPGVTPGTATPGTLPQTGGTATAPVTSTITSTVPSTGTGGTITSTIPSTGTATGAGPQVFAPAKNAGTMVEATIGEPETLDPPWAYDTGSAEVIFNVYETLLFMKKDSTTEFVPMLATKWDISPDGMTYTFTIRKGVTFHDGSPLTPEDVAYSFWRGFIQDRSGGPMWILLQPFFGLDVTSFADGVVQKQFGGDWAKAVQAAEQAVTFDNNAGTVTMHLKQPFGPMLQVLTGSWASILSKQWVVKQGGWDGNPATAQQFHDPTAEKDELFNKMNGTGPFKLDRWATGQEIDLVRNDNYWLKEPLWQGGPSGPAKVQRVVIKYISEFGTRFATFKTGDADIAYIDRQYSSQVDPLIVETCDVSAKCAPAQGSGTVRLWKNLPSPAIDAVYFTQQVNTTGGNQNLGSGKLDGNGIPPDFFSDVNIRKAFNYCFDWDTYIKQIWNGEALQALGPVPQGQIGYDASQAKYSFDLNKCAESFKASTLKSADGKSVWDTGFTIQYVYNAGNDQRRVAGEILKNSLQQVNPKFKFNVVDEPGANVLKDLIASRLPIYMFGWLEDYHDPQDWVVPFLSSGGAYSAYQAFDKTLQAQLDQLITQGVSETDKAKREQIYRQLQNLTYENALDIFLVQPLVRHYEQTWVKGYYYNPIYPGIYFYSLSK